METDHIIGDSEELLWDDGEIEEVHLSNELGGE